METECECNEVVGRLQESSSLLCVHELLPKSNQLEHWVHLKLDSLVLLGAAQVEKA